MASVRTLTSTRVRAPELLLVVDVLLRAHEAPHDRRAQVQRGLLGKTGADACPSCSTPLAIEGYRETRTSFTRDRTLTCGGCGTTFVLDEKHVA